MAAFTYQIPDEKKFFYAIRHILSQSKSDSERTISENLIGGRCSIVTTNQFSGKRWDAYSTSVTFYVEVQKLEFFEGRQKEILLKVCDRVMPKDTGYEIQSVDVSPQLDEITTDYTLSDDLEVIKNTVSDQSLLHLPDDIRLRGKEMANAYIYLYCVENSLRLFIDKVFQNKIGGNYFDDIIVPSNVKRSIQVRKELEGKNQWIGIRGNQTLFYLDFKELSNIISSNWETFKEYFPDQQWLNVKIDELGNCRNLIAHNSFISDMERDVIRLNYNQIIKQIQKVELNSRSTQNNPQNNDSSY